MDIEFHYYMTYLIATRAGFLPEDAQKIAYSAQYIDDNTINFVVNKNKETEFNGQLSQTMNPFKPQEEQLKIYPVFHFIPGDPEAKTAQRKDGKAHPYNTTPNSQNAQHLFQMALSAKDLYWIGIMCHAYADTWAHQNFVGFKDTFNAMPSAGGVARLLPCIGHAQAKHYPDWPALVWEDTRLINSKIDNKDRFLEAASEIFYKLSLYNTPTPSRRNLEKECGNLIADLDQAIGKTDNKNNQSRERIKRYKDLALKPEYGEQAIPDYSKTAWLDAAVRKDQSRGGQERTAGRSVSANYDHFEWRDERLYQETDWYKFQCAINRHQVEALEYLESVLPSLSELKVQKI